MEMDNFLSNTQIGKILSNLLNLIKENYKFVLYSTAGFLFISLIYSFSLSPKYQIIADVKLKDESGNASLPSSSSVLSLITGGGAGNNFWDFYNIVFSTEVAEILSDNEKKKLKKIEGALEKILDGIRQDKKAVADGGDRELLFKSLEAQLNHGFEAIQKFRGEEVSNGFVAVS